MWELFRMMINEAEVQKNFAQICHQPLVKSYPQESHLRRWQKNEVKNNLRPINVPFLHSVQQLTIVFIKGVHENWAYLGSGSLQKSKNMREIMFYEIPTRVSWQAAGSFDRIECENHLSKLEYRRHLFLIQSNRKLN